MCKVASTSLNRRRQKSSSSSEHRRLAPYYSQEAIREMSRENNKAQPNPMKAMQRGTSRSNQHAKLRMCLSNHEKNTQNAARPTCGNKVVKCTTYQTRTGTPTVIERSAPESPGGTRSPGKSVIISKASKKHAQNTWSQSRRPKERGRKR